MRNKNEMRNEALTLEILKGLIKCDTVNPPGNEKNGALYLKKIFEEKGISCEIQELGNNRANFVASFGTGEKILEFSGHLDVVPCIGDWKHAPLDCTEEGKYIYGRGGCDMKGGIAAMCSAAISLYESQKPLNGIIRLTFVADEEQANLGMHKFLDTHKAADYTILGEPTDLHIAVAHRGVARYYIDLLGHASHAALRSAEETSVHKAARAILAISRLNEKLLTITHVVLPSPSIVVTMVNGYEKDNVVPGNTRLLVDFRILPGMQEKDARKMVMDALKEADIEGYTMEEHFFMPGGEVPIEDSFVQTCLIAAEKIHNSKEEAQAFGASCEQCFLVEKGSSTVICGPGSLDQAHTVDEFVEKAQVLKAVELYQQIALETLK